MDFLCVWFVCVPIHTVCITQLSSFTLWVWVWELNLGYQTWHQVSSPTESFHWPNTVLFKIFLYVHTCSKYIYFILLLLLFFFGYRFHYVVLAWNGTCNVDKACLKHVMTDPSASSFLCSDYR